LARHQQAADQLGCNLLGGAGEEGWRGCWEGAWWLWEWLRKQDVSRVNRMTRHPPYQVTKDFYLICALALMATTPPSEASSFTKPINTDSSNKHLIASARCKTLANGGEKYRLCIDGKRGSITRQSDSGQINFILDKCAPNSSNYVSSYTEKNGGIDMATYRSTIWDYCNKGW